MPGMNVPFEGEELAAVTAAARAAGKSTREYIREAALDRALAKQSAFLEAALRAYEDTKAAFAEFDPEDAAQGGGLRDAEAEAAAGLADMERPARGSAA